MWKIGDKCQLDTGTGAIIPDCEIVDISFETELVQVKHPKYPTPGLWSLESIICNHFYNDLGVDYCDLVGEDAVRCAYCPALDEFNIDDF